MRRFFVSFVSLVVISVLLSPAAKGAHNNYVTADSLPKQLLVQPDGRTLVAVDDFDTVAIARFLADGSPDTSFGDEGVAKVGASSGFYGRTLDFALQSDGKIVAIARARYPGTTRVVRLNRDGSIDKTFGYRGGVTVPDAEVVLAQPDGKTLVGGSNVECDRYTRCGGPSTLTRLLSTGSPDPGFASGGVLTFRFGFDIANTYADTSIVDLDQDSTGNIYASGEATYGAPLLAKFTPDGTPFPGFGVGGLSTAENGLAQLEIQGSNISTVVTKYDPPEVQVARYGLDMSVDDSFGTNGIASVPYTPAYPDLLNRPFQTVGPLATQDGGVMLVSEEYMSCPGSSYLGCTGGPFLARLDSGGQLDPSWGGDGIVTTDLGIQAGEVVAAGLQPDGKLIVGASKGSPGGIDLIRYNDDGSIDTTFGTDGISQFPEHFPGCLGHLAGGQYAIVDGYSTVGDNESNSMAGSDANDEISGRAGNDFICGYGGGDALSGNADNDRLSGGTGADSISGGPGTDTIYGGAGRDGIRSGPGNDKILARDGLRDQINCGPGTDKAWVDRKDIVKGCEKVFRKH